MKFNVITRYGETLAIFEETVLTAWGKPVAMTAIMWDAEYGFFRGFGFYLKKDGTPGRQIAKPIMGPAEVPAEIRTALKNEH